VVSLQCITAGGNVTCLIGVCSGVQVRYHNGIVGVLSLSQPLLVIVPKASDTVIFLAQAVKRLTRFMSTHFTYHIPKKLNMT
jgi:hypothetical protein